MRKNTLFVDKILAKLSGLIKKSIPWYAKIIIKIFLSHFPVRHKIWRMLPLIHYGPMQSSQYAYSIFTKHFSMTKNMSSFVCLELEPGDSLFSALIARAFGSKKVFLVDVEDCASRSMIIYHSMYSFLLEKGYNLEVDLSNFDNLMRSCRAVYLTSGLQSLMELPDNSVDFIFSNAVLEHIRRSEFLPTLKELQRILKPTGICSHVVDLRDHLGGGLNHLRFSNLIWESDFFVKSGFYTNRIRFSEMLSFFEKAGFKINVISKNIWNKLPTPKSKLHKQFCQLSDQDLNIASFIVSLTF